MKTLALTLGLALATAAPIAATAAEPAKNACFSTRQWQGWSAPEPDMLYLKVGMHDVYRVGLTAGSPRIDRLGTFLVSETRTTMVCSPRDLDLRIADQNGPRGPLIATSLVKLTPEEVAAIPKKDRP